MTAVWIIGAGKAGLHALEGLLENPDIHRFVLVDPARPQLPTHQKIEYVQMEGIPFLKDHLDSAHAPEWIIPALPLHLAAGWCQAVLGSDKMESIGVPLELDSCLPNPMHGANDDLYVIHANFLCPLNCQEPDQFCTVTRKPRKKDMHAILDELIIPDFHSIVIQSYSAQLN